MEALGILRHTQSTAGVLICSEVGAGGWIPQNTLEKTWSGHILIFGLRCGRFLVLLFLELFSHGLPLIVMYSAVIGDFSLAAVCEDCRGALEFGGR